MNGLISTLIIFITLMVIGNVCVRTGMLSEYFAKDASKLVLNILICATIINSVITNPPTLSTGETMKILGLTFILYISFYIISAPFAFLFSPSKELRGVVLLLMAINNNVFIGVPVAAQAFGNEAVFYVIIGCIPFNMLVYSVGVYILKRSGSSEGNVGLKDMLSAALIATIIALIIFVFDIKLPPVLISLVSVLSSATMPMSMFVIGAALSGVNLLEAFKKPALYLIALVKLIIMPLITWLLFRYMTDSTALLGSFVIAAACPSGIVVSALSIQFDNDAVFPSECILMDTALSMVTIPILLNILF